MGTNGGAMRMGWAARRLLGCTMLVPVAFALAGPAAAQAPGAAPTGGRVSAGSAAIAQTPATTRVTQTSNRAAIDWQRFDVGRNHAVEFRQPSASSWTLNRVDAPDPSLIAGRVTANGGVAIVNRSGVVFAEGAQVNVGSLIASAANITNQNFMAGRMVFDGAPNPGARVENRGDITVADRGIAALVAPGVANAGTIRARLGRVALAGAETYALDLAGDGLLSVEVTGAVRRAPDGATALVTNSGVVEAQGGSVLLTAEAAQGLVEQVVRNTGRVSVANAGGAAGQVAIRGRGGDVRVDGTVDATGARGGRIAVEAAGATATVGAGARLDASGSAASGEVRLGGAATARAVAAGTLAARGTGAGVRGGLVAAQAKSEVLVEGGAKLDASGVGGGGTVLAGTTGIGRAQTMAARTTVERGATLAADATEAGTGGTVVVNSTARTEVRGALSARGGPTGGDGGFIEISGQGAMELSAAVDLAAPAGRAGSFLLDPSAVRVVDDLIPAATPPDQDLPAPGTTITASGGDGAFRVTADSINALAAGTVTIEALTTISIEAPIQRSGELRLNAGTGVSQTSAGTISVGTLRIRGFDGTAATGSVALLANNAVQVLDAFATGSLVFRSASSSFTVTRAEGASVALSAPGLTLSGPVGGTAATAVTLRTDELQINGGSVTTTLDSNGTGTGTVAIGPLNAGFDVYLGLGFSGQLGIPDSVYGALTTGTLRLGETTIAGAPEGTTIRTSNLIVGDPVAPAAARVGRELALVAGTVLQFAGGTVTLDSGRRLTVAADAFTVTQALSALGTGAEVTVTLPSTAVLSTIAAISAPTVTLTAGGIDLGGPVTAATELRLTANGAAAPSSPLGQITQTSNGLIDTALLVLDASGGVNLDGGGTARNTVDGLRGGAGNDGLEVLNDGPLTITGDLTALGGFLVVDTTGPLTVAAVATVSAPFISLSGASVDLLGNITASGGFGSTGVSLSATGSAGTGTITQAATSLITTDELSVSSTGSAVLDRGGLLRNAVGALTQVSTATGFQLRNAGDLAILDDLNNGTGTLLINTNGALSVDAPVSSQHVALFADTMSFDPSSGFINADFGAGVLVLAPASSGRPVQVGGTAPAGALYLDLSSASRLQAGTLVIGSPDAGTLTLAGNVNLRRAGSDEPGADRLRLSSGASILQTAGRIDVPGLGADAGGSIDLRGANRVDRVAAMADLGDGGTSNTPVAADRGITAGGGVALTIDGSPAPAPAETLTVDDAIRVGTGAVLTLRADDLELNARLEAPAGTIELLPVTQRRIYLGDNTGTTGFLVLSTAELARIGGTGFDLAGNPTGPTVAAERVRFGRSRYGSGPSSSAPFQTATDIWLRGDVTLRTPTQDRVRVAEFFAGGLGVAPDASILHEGGVLDVSGIAGEAQDAGFFTQQIEPHRVDRFAAREGNPALSFQAGAANPSGGANNGGVNIWTNPRSGSFAVEASVVDSGEAGGVGITMRATAGTLVVAAPGVWVLSEAGGISLFALDGLTNRGVIASASLAGGSVGSSGDLVNEGVIVLGSAAGGTSEVSAGTAGSGGQITNSGQIIANVVRADQTTNTGSIGVTDLYGGLTNQAGGLVRARNVDAVLFNQGAVLNQAGATIEAGTGATSFGLTGAAARALALAGTPYTLAAPTVLAPSRLDVRGLGGVENFGTIRATSAPGQLVGVSGTGTSSVQNRAGGVIEGSGQVTVFTDAGEVRSAGTIRSTGAGVELRAPGGIFQPGGTIEALTTLRLETAGEIDMRGTTTPGSIGAQTLTIAGTPSSVAIGRRGAAGGLATHTLDVSAISGFDSAGPVAIDLSPPDLGVQTLLDGDITAVGSLLVRSTGSLVAGGGSIAVSGAADAWLTLEAAGALVVSGGSALSAPGTVALHGGTGNDGVGLRVGPIGGGAVPIGSFVTIDAEHVVMTAGRRAGARDDLSALSVTATSITAVASVLLSAGGGVSTGPDLAGGLFVAPGGSGWPIVMVDTRRSGTPLGATPAAMTAATIDIPGEPPAAQRWQVLAADTAGGTYLRFGTDDAPAGGVASGAARPEAAGAASLALSAGGSPLFLLIDGGTATGEVQAGRIGVHALPGSTTLSGGLSVDLTGTLDGRDDGTAAQLGRTTAGPTTGQDRYLFNGCVIGATACTLGPPAPPPPIIVVVTPPPTTTTTTPTTATTTTTPGTLLGLPPIFSIRTDGRQGSVEAATVNVGERDY